jgi:hypothetical protein
MTDNREGGAVMPHRHTTTYAEREQFVQLHRAGLSYARIAQQSGWKYKTVRKHCQAYRRRGVEALRPKRPGPPRRGLLSAFAGVVRFAALRVKRKHLAWGPAVVLDELHQRASTRSLPLPHVSQLAAYFQSFGSRLVQPRRRLELPPPVSPPTGAPDHLVFQLDMQERLHVPALGYCNVLNVRAPQWGLTVGCYPHPAGEHRWKRKVSQAEIREDCRKTFERWGLPDVLQTDRDQMIVPSGDYPFPSCFTLWLVGLGIEHRLIQRVTQNGSVERTHRTFDKQMLSGIECNTWPEFIDHIDRELARLNERLPSRAKACRGQVPIQAHPEALSPKRPYCRDLEGQLFDMQRVYAYLAGGRWVRQASTHGQFHLGDQVWNLGRHFENQAVVVKFSAETREFVITTVDGEEIKRMPSDWINPSVIRGLSDYEAGKVQT